MSEDRSAGRWCDVCQQHGGHHTDRHPPLSPHAENDRLRRIETAAACVLDVYSGHGGHVHGLRGAMRDLSDALTEAGR